MPKFRKKPVVIEAVQYTGRNAMDILAFAQTSEISEDLGGGIEIPTLEGTMRADIGDWIIRGVKDEFYPIKNDIFLVTYDPVE